MAKVNYARYAITLSLIALINVEVSTSDRHENFECSQIGPCRCKQSDDYLIDLSPLENYTNPGSGFLTTANNYGIYFFHPCSDLLLTPHQTACSLYLFVANTPGKSPLNEKDVINDKINGTFYRLAYASQAVFQFTESEISLIYHLQNISSVIINLKCDDVKEKSTLSMNNPNLPINLTNHHLILHSPYSCFRSFPNDKHYMSGFGVFCIIMLTIAAIYFFGGMLVLKHIKGATGTEMIPNYEFWISLPSRCKNFFNRLIGRGTQGTNSYESI